eukprot:scaffold908_cov333-Prasinococcus_capsulatus_cf.AAC.13
MQHRLDALLAAPLAIGAAAPSAWFVKGPYAPVARFALARGRRSGAQDAAIIGPCLNGSKQPAIAKVNSVGPEDASPTCGVRAQVALWLATEASPELINGRFFTDPEVRAPPSSAI